ncbi:MAG: SMC-Scp complex subunit ScpB, partial [Acidobacteria bacterium]|nr:SMC-Scp complex subunit ScpB [Acidobacteriota bacterium]
MEAFGDTQAPLLAAALDDAGLKALIEAVVYVAGEPVSPRQIADGLAQPLERVERLLAELMAGFDRPEHGIEIREVA